MQPENGLPASWRRASLGEISTPPQYGWTTKAVRDGEGLPLVRTTDMSSGEIAWETVPRCAQDPPDPEKYLLRSGDILVSRAGSVGRSYLVKDAPPSVFASYLIRFHPNEGIEPEFVALYMRSRRYWSAIADSSAGIALPNVNGSKLKRLELPVPPQDEQRQIVSRVEQLDARLNRARASIANAANALDRCREAVLGAACSGRLTAQWRDERAPTETGEQLLARLIGSRREKWIEHRMRALQAAGKPTDPARIAKRYREPYNEPASELPELPETWTWAPVDAISTTVVDGVHKKPSYIEDGVPFITVKNLTAGSGISFEDVRYVSEDDHRAFVERAHPESGDLLVSKDGTLGVVRAIRTDRVFSIFVSVALIKPIENAMSDYLELALSSPQVQRQMVGVGSGLQHIHLRDLKVDYIPLPPLDEQREIVNRVRSAVDATSAIEDKIGVAQNRVEVTGDVILERALSGELIAASLAPE